MSWVQFKKLVGYLLRAQAVAVIVYFYREDGTLHN